MITNEVIEPAVKVKPLEWGVETSPPSSPLVVWQTMETAPKGANGVCWMLLAHGPEPDRKVSFGMRIGEKFFAASVFYVGGPSSGKQYAFKGHEVAPTHWATIPDAPSIPIPEGGDARAPLPGPYSAGISEVETDDGQKQGNRDADRQGGESREIGGLGSLLASSLQRSERYVCREDSSIDRQVTDGGGVEPPSLQTMESIKPAPDLASENERLRAALEFVQLWAWRDDPPNAARNLSDSERLSAIKYHPSIVSARAALERT